MSSIANTVRYNKDKKTKGSSEHFYSEAIKGITHVMEEEDAVIAGEDSIRVSQEHDIYDDYLEEDLNHSSQFYRRESVCHLRASMSSPSTDSDCGNTAIPLTEPSAPSTPRSASPVIQCSPTNSSSHFSSNAFV